MEAAMKPLALTIGDPSGIGVDLALELWLKRKQLNLPAFIFLADPAQLHARADKLGLTIKIAESDTDKAATVFESQLPVLPLKNSLIESPGIPLTENAAGIIESIESAVSLTMSGHASAVVTCPIAKKPLYEAGFTFPGHTEFLAYLATKRTDINYMPVMLLAGPELKTVPVTVHIPLHEVTKTLTADLIIRTARILDHDLRSRFNIDVPRIAVSGVNPHAGESGSLGQEDQEIIVPAIHALQNEGINAFGPLPADTMFHKQARSQYDVALCMYHDQALIPVKALGFDESVNATLGLPFIRTSPDHGTAFDIAAKNIARPDSLLAALKLAHKLSN